MYYIKNIKLLSKEKGFTLIELLVVIAIIGILAGILVVAIDPKAQTNKADDVTKKGNLKQIKTISTLYLDNHSNSYLNLCSNADVSLLITETSAVCYDEATAWAAETTLSGEGDARYCIDSTGYAGDTSSALGVNDTSCNQ